VENFFARRAAPLRIVRAHDRVAQSRPRRMRRRRRATVCASQKRLCRNGYLHRVKIAAQRRCNIARTRRTRADARSCALIARYGAPSLSTIR
jgi:hypothetical protein